MKCLMKRLFGYGAVRLVEVLKMSGPPYLEDPKELEPVFGNLWRTVLAVARLLVTRVNAWEIVNKEGVKIYDQSVPLFC